MALEVEAQGLVSENQTDKNERTNPEARMIQNNRNEKSNGFNSNNQEEEDDETRCGFWKWSPGWLQYLASKKTYVLIYGVLGSSQSAMGAYFIGTISTIEKRFKMPSATSGMIASAWDIGAVCAAMLMAYFGSRGHKTRWVATGALIAAISCYLRFIPHVLYGPGDDAIGYGTEKPINVTGDLCGPPVEIEENCSLGSESFTTFMILLVAHILLGVGTSTYYTLGAAYLDDNSLKNKVPILFAISTSLRMIGPSAGFLIASFALDYFVDMNIKPSFSKDDPRWIGAWWLGWIPIGMVHVFFSFLMALFPKTLPREAKRRQESNSQWSKKTETSMADFLATMKRLVKNPILMFNSFSTTFYIFGMIGYWIFMPKYLETQFRLSASKASLITGSIGLICSAVGVIASGAAVSYFKPRPTYLAAWNVFTESVDVIGHIAFAFLGCPKDDLHGVLNDEGKWNLTVGCNGDCNCHPSTKYSPVCSWDNKTTFYSPCHAGCSSIYSMNNTKFYYNCSCIPEFQMARPGQCPVDCNFDFMIFLILLCTMKFLSSTGRSGNTMIQFRAVAPEDKSISIAITEVLLCLVAFIPAPIFYGYLMDSSCSVWGMTCGTTGNCWLYDGKMLRYFLNFTSSGFLLIAALLDVGVLCHVGNLKIYDEDLAEEEKKKEEECMKNETDLPLIHHDID